MMAPHYRAIFLFGNCLGLHYKLRLANSTVFGVCPSIIAPTATNASFPTTVLRNPSRTCFSPRSTSSASVFSSADYIRTESIG